MKKILISVFVSIMLLSILVMPAIADEVGKTATVHVNTYKSVTLTDPDPAGLQFASLNPGAVKQPEFNSPSITITAAAENNADVAVSINGTDFAGPGGVTFDIGNAYWNTGSDSGSATAMSKTPASVATLHAGAIPPESVDIYHWLSIPSGQAAGDYSSTFTYATQ